jgi:L-rhamnose mutarotase
MIMEVNDTFSFDRKSSMDAVNEKVQEWETLMWKYQQPVPGAKSGEKWIMMDRIFELKDY